MIKAKPIQYEIDFEYSAEPIKGGPERKIVLEFMPWVSGNMMWLKIYEKDYDKLYDACKNWKQTFDKCYYDKDYNQQSNELAALATQDVRGQTAERMAYSTFYSICGQAIYQEFAPNYWEEYQKLIQRVSK